MKIFDVFKKWQLKCTLFDDFLDICHKRELNRNLSIFYLYNNFCNERLQSFAQSFSVCKETCTIAVRKETH